MVGRAHEEARVVGCPWTKHLAHVVPIAVPRLVPRRRHRHHHLLLLLLLMLLLLGGRTPSASVHPVHPTQSLEIGHNVPALKPPPGSACSA